MRIHAFILALLLPLLVLAQVYTPEQVPNVQKQDYKRLVSDPEGYFSESDRLSIDQALVELREKHTVEVVVVVLPSIQDDDPEGFTLRLFELWGVGKSADNNGLLILYVYGAQGNRVIRFETGYGLEGALPDITTKRLTDRILVPMILEGRDAEGFVQVAHEIDRLLAEGYEARNEGNVPYGEDPYYQSDEYAFRGIRMYIIFSAILGLVYAMGLFARWRKTKEPVEQLGILQRRFSNNPLLFFILPALIFLAPLYYGLRSSSRRRLRNCPKCGTRGSISIIESPANESYLLTNQLAEQRVRSVLYTVYACSLCDYNKIVGKVIKMSGYQKCPNCGNRTFKLISSQNISRSKTRDTYRCVYCNYTRRSVRSHQSGGGPVFLPGGGRSFGGGFGGGSIGGGFGGGRSGGGGSTTRF